MAFTAAAGRIAAEQVMFYPPGIPILVPGDRVTEDAIHYIRAMQAVGRKVVGPEDASLQTLLVLGKASPFGGEGGGASCEKGRQV